MQVLAALAAIVTVVSVQGQAVPLPAASDLTVQMVCVQKPDV